MGITSEYLHDLFCVSGAESVWAENITRLGPGTSKYTHVLQVVPAKETRFH